MHWLALALCLVALELGAATPAYPPSELITGIEFDRGSIRTAAPGSDNWVITWAADGHQYATFGDGGGCNGGTNSQGRVGVGVARLEGTADGWRCFNRWGGYRAENPAQFDGKAYGILDVAGELWLWRAGDASENSAYRFSELWRSTDRGATFRSVGWRFDSPGFFTPGFVQFGQGYAGARDGYVYVYAPRNHTQVWDVQRPGEIVLLRAVHERMAERGAWEAITGFDAGVPRWGQVSAAIPIWRDASNGAMRTSISYNTGLKRYLLTTQQVSRFSPDGNIGIYEAPEPWGPWRTVLLANAWDIGLNTGSKTVYWNFSNKWASADGRDFVLVYTGPDSDELGTIRGRFEVGTVEGGPPSTPTGLRISIQSD